MRKLITLLLLLSATSLVAQDLNIRVQVVSPKIQSTNKKALETLETAIRDFMNNTKWTNDVLRPQERIDCNLVINVTEWDGSSNFKAEAQLQSSRPVYNSTYSSPMLNVNDKDFDFNYSEGQPLDYNEQTFTSNLTSLLGFYANLIVGFDYDSFSRLGGSPYFNKMQLIVNNAQNTPYKGWKAFDGLRNRYWLADNMGNKGYSPLRQLMYDYHRNGLDLMADNVNKGRKNILGVIPELLKLDKQKLGAMFPTLFFTAKADEFVSVLGKASPQEKMEAYNTLSQIDPGNLSKYEGLRK